MKIFSFAYVYLALKNERGRPIYLRDLAVVAILAVIISGPFIFIPGAPFFSKDGFLDKFSAFSGVLTGFYVAALIAVATLTSTSANLDGPIESGAVFFPKTSARAGKSLSRRQYVCLMFGYLAFMSVVMSLISVLSVSISAGFKQRYFEWNLWDSWRVVLDINKGRSATIVLVSILVSHMVITTLHGLYYLTDRLYARKAKMLPRPDATKNTVGGEGVPSDDV